MSIVQAHTPPMRRWLLVAVLALLALGALGGLAPSRAVAAAARGGEGSAHGQLSGARATGARHRGCALSRTDATSVRFGVIRSSGRRLEIGLTVSPGRGVARLVGCGSFAARVQVTLQRGTSHAGLAVIAMPEVYVATRRLHAGHQVLRLRLPSAAPDARNATLRLAIGGLHVRGTRLAPQTISARLRVRPLAG